MNHKITIFSMPTARKILTCLASFAVVFILVVLLIQTTQAASEQSHPMAPAQSPNNTSVGGNITEDTVWNLIHRGEVKMNPPVTETVGNILKTGTKEFLKKVRLQPKRQGIPRRPIPPE